MSCNRLAVYLNQRATLERSIGSKGDGSAKKGDPETIKVRKERIRRMTTDQYGNQVLSETTIMTSDIVQPGDYIDGVKVVSVLDMVWSDGTIEGYEALQ